MARHGNMPGGFTIEEVDRSFRHINRLCLEAFGGYPSSPLYAGVEIVRRTGSLAIFDAGCGTGRGMVEFGEKVSKVAKCDPSAVSGVGVSLHDFRGMSRNSTIDEAFASGQYEYRLGGCESMPHIPSGAFDVAISYDGLIYSDDPRAWASELMRAVKPGGVVIFDARPRQCEEQSPLMEEIGEWREAGFAPEVHPTLVVHDELVYGVVWIRAEKPMA